MLAHKAAHISVWGLVAALFFIHISPAMASLSLGVAVLGWCLGSVRGRWDYVGLAVGFGLLLIDAGAFQPAQGRAHLLLHLPVYALMFRTLSSGFAMEWKSRFVQWWWAWSLPPVWFALASMGEYWQHREFYSQMVLESKPMPLFSQVYHIEFSVLLALMLLLLLQVWLNEKGGQKWAMASVWGLGFLCLHGLSARTGMLLFWVGVVPIFWPSRKQLGLRSQSIAVLVLLLLLMWFRAPLQNRLSNTWSDLQAIAGMSDVNGQSLGQRTEAWKAAWRAVRQRPALGWGSGATTEAMNWAYERGTRLERLNWIGPHNQWLEMAIQGGFIALLLVLIQGFRWMMASPHSGWMLGLALAACFESLAERQAGVLAWVLALMWLLIDANQEKPGENLGIE